MTENTSSGAAFGDDPGSDTFQVFVNGMKIDPKSLPGYVTTGPNVSIAEAAKTGDWTIRDDGLIEYVRPMTAQTAGQVTAQHNPPTGLCVVVCDKTGAVVRVEGSPVPDGVVIGEPMPAPAAVTVPAVPAVAPAVVVTTPAASYTPPATEATAKVSVAPIVGGGFLARIEREGEAVAHAIATTSEAAWAWIREEWARWHGSQG